MKPSIRAGNFFMAVFFSWTFLIFVGILNRWNIPLWQLIVGMILSGFFALLELGITLFSE